MYLLVAVLPLHRPARGSSTRSGRDDSDDDGPCVVSEVAEPAEHSCSAAVFFGEIVDVGGIANRPLLCGPADRVEDCDGVQVVAPMGETLRPLMVITETKWLS